MFISIVVAAVVNVIFSRHLLSSRFSRMNHWLLERYFHQFCCLTSCQCRYSCSLFWWTSLWMLVPAPTRSLSFSVLLKSTTSGVICSRFLWLFFKFSLSLSVSSLVFYSRYYTYFFSQLSHHILQVSSDCPLSYCTVYGIFLMLIGCVF